MSKECVEKQRNALLATVLSCREDDVSKLFEEGMYDLFDICDVLRAVIENACSSRSNTYDVSLNNFLDCLENGKE